MSGDDRAYPTRPLCGVGVIAFNGQGLLLIRRGKEPLRGQWSIPGGAVELGETVREAAVREFREECGGEVELHEVVDAVDVITRDEAGRVQYQYVLVDFWGEWSGGTLRATSDILEARWVTPDALDEYQLPALTRRVIDKAVEAHARK